jgi:hypothetical protein
MVGRAPAGVIVPNRRAGPSGGLWKRELRLPGAGRTLRLSDIAVTLTNIERLLGEDENDGEEEADEG